MPVSSKFWKGKRVFLTGHTGFKGSWLSIWLQSMGAELAGLALDPPTDPNLFEVAGVGEGIASTIGDIRDALMVRRTMEAFRPEVVFHMAAQPLVRYSYAEPVETYATNVMGTVHVLEAVRHCASVRCVVNVTTDKCYENREWTWGYRENEPMGGHDPYSNSKGCAELVTSAYRRSFLQSAGVALASARAGNVIGGGDWASDRLVPDVLRAFQRNETLIVRNPDATRPWQHVLEPLSGYLCLAERLWMDGQRCADGWNFGPRDDDARPVRWIADRMVKAWQHAPGWRVDGGEHPHEAHYLKLDISKARHGLNWRPRWDLETALGAVMDWHRTWLADRNMRDACCEQIARYSASTEEVIG